MSKKRLAGMVAEVYEGSEEKHLTTIEYWMTFPKIALIAIIGDTYLDGK
ncbi:MAG: hypothetical protein GY865_17490 [candidate division Zixibacteria bacterium]|nr:hypothetical protein [candidate division Zixibacteria bacterium]